MQKRFLELNADLKSNKLKNIVGLWLLTGDEPLVQNWAIDALRPIFLSNHQTIKRIDLTSPKHWQTVIDELSTLSLFDDGVVLIVQGKQKCDDKQLIQLTNFAESQTNNALIYQLPKQDKKAQTSKFYKLFLNQGVIVDCNLYNEKDRQNLLAVKAQEFGLSLTDMAWQYLMSHTENNLLSAHQTLWRASDLYAQSNHPILDIHQLLPVLDSDYQYSVFEFSDQLLLGNIQKCLHILHHLARTDAAPSVVLWAINKEVRTLLQLKNGKSMTELGIWQSKSSLYQTALQRPINNDLLSFIYKIDQSIKGIDSDGIWQQIEMACLMFCGITPFKIQQMPHQH